MPLHIWYIQSGQEPENTHGSIHHHKKLFKPVNVVLIDKTTGRGKRPEAGGANVLSYYKPIWSISDV